MKRIYCLAARGISAYTSTDLVENAFGSSPLLALRQLLPQSRPRPVPQKLLYYLIGRRTYSPQQRVPRWSQRLRRPEIQQGSRGSTQSHNAVLRLEVPPVPTLSSVAVPLDSVDLDQITAAKDVRVGHFVRAQHRDTTCELTTTTTESERK